MGAKDTEMTSSPSCIRLSVLGAKGVGKTAIIVRYLTRRYIGEYHSQIDITYRQMISMSNRQTQIVIMDFSSKNEKDLAPDLESLISDCFLVVYSIDDRSSFLKAVNIVSMLRSFPSCSATPITLLGNKNDLEHSRQVSSEELLNMASLLCCQFSEVSVAESREDIVPIVFNLFRRVSFPEEFNNQVVNNTNDHQSFSSEPCLYDDVEPSTHSSCSRKRERSAEDGDKFETEEDRYIKVSDSYLYSSKCQVCSLQHEKYPTLANLPPQLRSSFHSSRSTAKRKFNQNLPTRAYSLNLKDRNNKKDSPRSDTGSQTIDYNYPYSSLPEENAFRKRVTKKDPSKLSSLLNCSKGERDSSDSMKPFNIKRNESSIASLLLRGRSFTNDSSKHESFKFSTFRGNNNNNKSFCRSRKTLPYRILSSENSSKDNKLKKFSFDLPRPPSIRALKILPEVITKRDEGRTTSRRPFGTCLDPLLIKKMGKASMEGSLTAENQKQRSIFTPSHERRERKFGVFTIGSFGNVFSKTSLPDLPTAASFCNKFGSIKNTIKKRSV